MRHCNQYCINCGDYYTYQASGHGCFHPHNNEKYCPTCQEAIINALKVIPKKSRKTSIKTDEVDLFTLLRWEQEERDEFERFKAEKEAKGEACFPMSRRISAALFKWDAGKLIEAQITGYVKGKEDKKGRHYHYAYWPSKKDQNLADITVGVRLSNEDKILEYITQ